MWPLPLFAQCNSDRVAWPTVVFHRDGETVRLELPAVSPGFAAYAGAEV